MKIKKKYATGILHLFTRLFLLLITLRRCNIRWRLDVRDLSKVAGPPPPRRANFGCNYHYGARTPWQPSPKLWCSPRPFLIPLSRPWLQTPPRSRHYPTRFVEMHAIRKVAALRRTRGAYRPNTLSEIMGNYSTDYVSSELRAIVGASADSWLCNICLGRLDLVAL